MRACTGGRESQGAAQGLRRCSCNQRISTGCTYRFEPEVCCMLWQCRPIGVKPGLKAVVDKPSNVLQLVQHPSNGSIWRNISIAKNQLWMTCTLTCGKAADKAVGYLGGVIFLPQSLWQTAILCIAREVLVSLGVRLMALRRRSQTDSADTVLPTHLCPKVSKCLLASSDQI